MYQLKLFIELIRLKKPIGFMLLFWPCAWGLTLAYDFSENINDYFFYLLLFFLGSVFMRSAGCIVNDILDKEFLARVIFGSCCLSMIISIIFFIREIQISTNALKLHMSDMDVDVN